MIPIAKPLIGKEEKSAVIHNGIDVQRFSQELHEEPEVKLKSKPDSIIIGSVGRLHHQKGYEYLIDASPHIIKEFPEVKFVLIGDGELKDELENLAKKKGINNSYIFLGSITNIPELLSQMDLFVLPSLWEGLPLVLLEAMAAKKPVVATGVNGVTEIIENEKDGILVHPKNSHDLSTAIIRLLKDSALMDRIAKAGFNKVSAEFNLTKMVKETEDIYLKYSKK